MNYALTKTNQRISTVQPALSAELDRALSLASNGLENGRLAADLLPAEVRASLNDRAIEIAVSLVPATDEGALGVIVSVSHMPSKTEVDLANVEAFMRLEVSDLVASRLPLWALEAAARSFRLGEAGDGHWRPTAGDLATLARAKVAALHREARKIDTVLRAKVDPPKKPASLEQRKAAADRLRAMAAGMTIGGDAA
jgi:hypothetical protein